MEVIRNEPSCYNAACHQHSKETSVLGVLDIVYSLDEIDRKLRTSTLGIAGFSLGFIAFAALLVGFFVHRLVYLPLRDLEGGAQRLSAGNLDQAIPVRSGDEFGKLASVFNGMTDALRSSRAQLRDWGHTLEQKVEKRTQELRRAQAETMRGEKLASVGLLASGVAHELNNPLTGILTFSHLVRQKMPDKSQMCIRDRSIASTPSRRSSFRNLGSRSTRARMVSLKSRVSGMAKASYFLRL